MSFLNSRMITMDRVSKKCIKTSLKLANSVMFITGITILMYSVWLIVVCVRDYQKYLFSWFLCACLGAGSIFSLIACIGHAGASTRTNFLLSLDFPKDHTKRFDDFVDFVESNKDNFRCLGLLIAFSQVLAFLLATVLGTMSRSESHRWIYEDEEVASAKLPFLDDEAQYSPLAHVVGQSATQYYYPAAPYMDTDMNTHTRSYAHGYPNVTCTGNKKSERVAPKA